MKNPTIPKAIKPFEGLGSCPAARAVVLTGGFATAACAKFNARVRRCGRAVIPIKSTKFRRYSEKVRSRISPSDKGRRSKSGMQSSFLPAGNRYLAMHCTKGEEKKRIAAVIDGCGRALAPAND